MKIGSLCSGYGGLDLAAEHVFGAETAWHVEYDRDASKVLTAHWGVPNYGDLTSIGWDAVEPVDIITAGYPCQPFSAAGRRQGANDERHLWPYVREAIRRIRPRIAVLENVAGHRSLGFDRVLGDLAEDGMHVRWTSLRASDIGSCHARERLWFIVTDPARDTGWLIVGGGEASTDSTCHGWNEGWPESARLQRGFDAAVSGAGSVDLIPTPRASDAGPRGGTTGFGLRNWAKDYIAEHLLPTPNAHDDNGGGRYSSDGHQSTLPGEVRLLPTPKSAERGDCASEHARNDPDLRAITYYTQDWGKYESAVKRWESVTRPAPPPTEPNRAGNPRLSAAFAEWMMGLPAGWVTDVDIPRNAQLRILGNGVVPQQAVAALLMLLRMEVAA